MCLTGEQTLATVDVLTLISFLRTLIKPAKNRLKTSMYTHAQRLKSSHRADIFLNLQKLFSALLQYYTAVLASHGSIIYTEHSQ